ncbi:RING finger protein 37-like isoform X2 [Ambystoma mexicanum]|uniref:RING finger protein 37-like isoform X2 n=1 Tax=Ambystoma mexicanum TaxID=8296 RepID=UPI0037E886FF
MAINVCLPQFRPRIHCNKITADGYEVENLISEDIVKRNRGFRCAYFVLPPVHITITFPFRVEISKINIDLATSGGIQKATGLEICTSTSSSQTSLSGQKSAKDVFTRVCKVQLGNRYKVTFHHRGFQARAPFDQAESPFSSDEFVSYELFNKGPLSLKSVKCLQIVITHVRGGGVPGCKRVEVWGQPARACSQELIDTVLQISNESVPEVLQDPTVTEVLQDPTVTEVLQDPTVPEVLQDPTSPMESNCMSYRNSDITQQSLQEFDLHDVPEEFLDPITLEVMTLPILLPSGNVIDQSTLEKCNRSEASWGRMPSDPFTGVTYSLHSHPLPHPSLKARLDLFLLQHNIPGSNILGRAQAASLIAPSSITVASLKRKMGCMEQSVNGSNGSEPTCFAANCPIISTSENCAKKMKIDSELGTAQMDCSTVPVCHEQRLTQSLDMALTAALSSMPSFTAKLPRGTEQQPREGGSSSGSSHWNANTFPDHNRISTVQGCSSCSRTFSAYFKTEPVYQLPCGHLICRPCLSEKQKSFSVLCLNCKSSFAARDMLRVHL